MSTSVRPESVNPISGFGSAVASAARAQQNLPPIPEKRADAPPTTAPVRSALSQPEQGRLQPRAATTTSPITTTNVAIDSDPLLSADPLQTPQLSRFRYLDDTTAEAVQDDLNLLKNEWKARMDASIREEAAQTNNWSLIRNVEAAVVSLNRVIARRIASVTSPGKTPQQISNDIRIYRSQYGSSPESRLLALQALSSETRPYDRAVKEIALLQLELADLIAQSRKMFREFKRWSGCDGEIDLPQHRPPLQGFDALSGRVVDWFVMPLITVIPSFPLQRNVLMYGPPGSGKSIISQLTAYDMATRLRAIWGRNAITQILNAATVIQLPPPPPPLPPSGVVLTRLATAKDVETAVSQLPLGQFLVVYFVDAMRVRHTDPTVVQSRLRSYLNCLQFDVLQRRRAWSDRVSRNQTGILSGASPPMPLALFVLDNVDALFMTDDELHRQPRPARQSADFQGYLHRDPADASREAARAGGNNNMTESKKGWVARLDGARTRVGGGTVEQVVLDLLSPSSLQSEWSDVRALWLARYPWRLPDALRRLVQNYTLFVDLPNTDTRRSVVREWIRNQLYRNLAATLDERKVITEEKRRNENELAGANVPANKKADLEKRINVLNTFLQEDQTRKGEPDDALFMTEAAIRERIEGKFYNDALQTNPDRPPRQVVWEAIHQQSISTGAKTPTAIELVGTYLDEQMKPLIDFLVQVTGMSLVGYCTLQRDYQLTYSEVDLFMVTTKRHGDKGLALGGITPFGFTIEDLTRFMDTSLRQRINTRLLRTAIDKTRSFVYGSQQWAAPGCVAAARDTQIRRPSGSSSPLLDGFDLDAWLLEPGHGTDRGTCAIALGPNLRDLKTNLPVIPLSARFGSHRLLKDDAIRALGLFLPSVTLKPDYPEFVTFVLFGRPRLNRPPLPPDQISTICQQQQAPYRPSSQQGIQRWPSNVMTVVMPPATTQATYILPAKDDLGLFIRRGD